MDLNPLSPSPLPCGHKSLRERESPLKVGLYTPSGGGVVSWKLFISSHSLFPSYERCSSRLWHPIDVA